VLQSLKRQVTPGMTTKVVASLAAAELKSLGGKPAFLGYQGFPDVICISVNNEVVHGIPSDKKVLQGGDILSLDFGVDYEGMITDSALSMIVGKARSARHEQLIRATESSMLEGIAVLHDRVRTGDIGAAVQAVLENPKVGGPFGIVRDLVGHGVGHDLHEDPNIPNYGRANTGPWLDKGMTIAIEPMATLGSERVYVADDGWSIMTADGSWAAHFEHTVLITEDGFEIISAL
jgi:methionyl aminopeptidase